MYFISLSIGFKVIVQPCDRRVFTNREYKEAGAIVQDDLSEAGLVLGVKQLKIPMLTPERNYLFFSHVIKAQVLIRSLYRLIVSL